MVIERRRLNRVTVVAATVLLVGALSAPYAAASGQDATSGPASTAGSGAGSPSGGVAAVPASGTAAISGFGVAAVSAPRTGPSVRGTVAAAVVPCRSPVDLVPAGATFALVNRFDVGNHESGESIRYDRVVIGLDGVASGYRIRYTPVIVGDGSGEVVSLRGNADIEVIVQGASAHDDNGVSTIPVRRHTRDWTALREARVISDWEGYLQIGLGVSSAVDFTVTTLTNPNRLVIDLAMPGEQPWACASGTVRVYFFDQERYVENTEPFFTPVWRRVLTPAVAGGALNSLYHGPVFAETETGLRLLPSGSSGFTGLRIQNGVAHVQLTGGCDSGGSTVTVAGSIIPTLKQFSNVRYVKIYDPAGTTGDPVGPTDSIPDCLNP